MNEIPKQKITIMWSHKTIQKDKMKSTCYRENIEEKEL